METDTPAAAPKRKLRWYQYSLRTLLILVTLFAIACSWFTVKMKEAKRQRETVEAIQKLGGTVLYFWVDDADVARCANPYCPAWLRTLLGTDFCDRVYEVNLSTCIDADAGLELLNDLPHIETLRVGGGVFSSISDAGLANIGRLSRLKTLYLGNTSEGDAGLANLKGLKQLKGLWIENSGTSDEGLQHLESLDQLEELDLAMNHVTSAGLKYLKGLKQLRRLELRDTQVADDGLEYLEELKHLEYLGLNHTKITDAGLDHLKQLNQLQDLGLFLTEISDAGMEDLQKALPECKISWPK